LSEVVGTLTLFKGELNTFLIASISTILIVVGIIILIHFALNRFKVQVMNDRFGSGNW